MPDARPAGIVAAVVPAAPVRQRDGPREQSEPGEAPGTQAHPVPAVLVELGQSGKQRNAHSSPAQGFQEGLAAERPERKAQPLLLSRIIALLDSFWFDKVSDKGGRPRTSHQNVQTPEAGCSARGTREGAPGGTSCLNSSCVADRGA